MWSPGTSIVRRNVWHGRVFSATSAIVVADSGDELVLWVPEGAHRFAPRDGQRLPTEWELEEGAWRGPGTVQLLVAGRRYALVHFFRPDGSFRAWYANLEEPFRRTPLGIDIRDNLLDLHREPGAAWLWKDEDELREAVAAGVVSAAEADRIRGDGDLAAAEAAVPTGWEDFRPESRWRPEPLAQAWAVVALRTDRLALTPLAPRDIREYARFAPEPERELDLSTRSWRTDGFGFWAVREAATAALVGIAETHFAGPGVAGIEPDEVEIGWVVDPARRGEGIATEAARAAVGDLFDRAGVDHVVACIDPHNAPSVRVAEKLGLRRRGAGRARGGERVDVWELRVG